MKKSIIAIAFVAAFALTASATFAYYHMPDTVQMNSSKNSYNGVSSVATTGGVSINEASTCGSVYVKSGNATSNATGAASLNTNKAIHGDGTVQVNMDKGSVNEVASGAGTGGVNVNKAHVGGVVSVTSGSANSTVKGVTMMNSNVSVGCKCRPHRLCGCQN